MKNLPQDPLYYEFNRNHEPRLRIEPGETIQVQTEDAFSGQIRTDQDRRDFATMPFNNPLTGPVWIEGAEPGDALAVKIERIEPSIGQCATRTGHPKQVGEWIGRDCPHGTHVCPIRDGLIHWSDRITIPYAPMLGCIGTAPASGAPTTDPAGPHGGNVDIREVCPGNTVYLPIFVSGGFLYVGDAHAAMGQGELSASGLEMPAESVLAVGLIKQQNLAGLRIESPDQIMTIATGCPMERAMNEAYGQLILWMEHDFGWDRWRAYDILTHVGEVSIGYHAIGTVAAKINKRYVHEA